MSYPQFLRIGDNWLRYSQIDRVFQHDSGIVQVWLRDGTRLDLVGSDAEALLHFLPEVSTDLNAAFKQHVVEQEQLRQWKEGLAAKKLAAKEPSTLKFAEG
jgi:hypothetical protein